jgi:Flp pilus assembly pilin Flp
LIGAADESLGTFLEGNSMEKMSLITRMRRRLKDQGGQSTTEYILILAIVVMIAGKMKQGLKDAVGGGVNNLRDVITESTDPSKFRD